MRRCLPGIKLLLLFWVVGFLACGTETPFRSQVDGDRPIELQLSERLRGWASLGGTPAGARQRMLDDAAPQVSQLWFPAAVGETQLVTVDVDDAPDGPCATQNFELWSIPGQPAIYICPRWQYCSREGDDTLYGPAGCLLHLAHELGHVLGARQHVPQNGRPLHASGPVICTWEPDCTNPQLRDYTDEDIALICGDGGHGGRCPERDLSR